MAPGRVAETMAAHGAAAAAVTTTAPGAVARTGAEAAVAEGPPPAKLHVVEAVDCAVDGMHTVHMM